MYQVLHAFIHQWTLTLFLIFLALVNNAAMNIGMHVYLVKLMHVNLALDQRRCPLFFSSLVCDTLSSLF